MAMLASTYEYIQVYNSNALAAFSKVGEFGVIVSKIRDHSPSILASAPGGTK